MQWYGARIGLCASSGRCVGETMHCSLMFSKWEAWGETRMHVKLRCFSAERSSFRIGRYNTPLEALQCQGSVDEIVPGIHRSLSASLDRD